MAILSWFKKASKYVYRNTKKRLKTKNLQYSSCFITFSLHIFLEFSVRENIPKDYFRDISGYDFPYSIAQKILLLGFVCTVRCIVKKVIAKVSQSTSLSVVELVISELDGPGWIVEQGLNLLLYFFDSEIIELAV